MERMRIMAVPALALLVLAAASAAAQPQATLDAVARDDGQRFWFTFAGTEGANPSPPLTRGQEVTLRLTNEGTSPHNFHVGRIEAEVPCCLQPGQDATLRFTVPADSLADLPYWCVPHKSLDMEGTFTVQGGTPRKPAATPLSSGVAVLALALAGTVGRTGGKERRGRPSR